MSWTGVGYLPGPVRDLKATKVSDREVTLVWQPPEKGTNITQYQLHYQSVDKHSASLAVYSLNNVSSRGCPVNIFTYQNVYFSTGEINQTLKINYAADVVFNSWQ